MYKNIEIRRILSIKLGKYELNLFKDETVNHRSWIVKKIETFELKKSNLSTIY